MTPPPVGETLDFRADRPLRVYDETISARAAALPHQRDHPQVLRELATLKRDFSWLYQDEELQARAGQIVEQWTRDFEANPERIAICKAWTSVLGGAEWRSAWEVSVGVTLTTRAERWERLGQRLGMGVPGRFRAYRGVKGISFVQAVVSAWQREEEFFAVRQRELASWSLDKDAAVRFASNRHASVIYAADIPFELTLADKWVDGGRFIAPYHRQYEVISGGSVPDGLLALARSCLVRYQNTWYTYDQRERIFERLRRR